MNSPSATKLATAPVSLGLTDLTRRPPAVFRLEGEQLASTLASDGSGYLQWGAKAVTRPPSLPAYPSLGVLIYLRDMDSGEFWSTTWQPTRVTPEDYRVDFNPGRVVYHVRHHGIESRMEVVVDSHHAAELRRVTLTNTGSTARRIEVTSYAEIVLQDSSADAAHPAFSKLFVETEFHSETRMLCARRRPRQSSEVPLWAGHLIAELTGSEQDGPVSPEFESDRSRFLGRGRSLGSPQALSNGVRLSGTVGKVLDPIFSLRHPIFLPPFASACISYSTVVSQSRDELIELASHYRDAGVVDAAMRDLEGSPSRQSPTSRRDPPHQTQPPLATTADHRQNELHSTGAEWQQLRADPAHIEVATAGSEPFSQPLTDGVRWDGAPTQVDMSSSESLLFDNGWGGFSRDGREYVIRLAADADGTLQLPPQPWVNIIANEQCGFIVSETGAGSTWAANSRLNRLTPWHNDPVTDPHSEAIYLRDEESGHWWSPLPGPKPAAGPYEVRHGFGFTKFLHTSHGIQQETTQFVPRDLPVKVTRVRLTNIGSGPRRLKIFGFVDWDLQRTAATGAETITTEILVELSAVTAIAPSGESLANRTAFFASVVPSANERPSLTADREEFIGGDGSVSAPRALECSEPLSGNRAGGTNPCAASQATVTLQPGETLECAYLLGQTDDAGEMESLLSVLQTPDQWQQAFDEGSRFWNELLSAVQIETPSEPLNLMVNGWLVYQNLSCRMWGRSSLYQSGGAFGFRDQLQDAAALMYHWPELTRTQILLNAAHQFVEGDVLHWWHPPANEGIRTRFADDLLWLPLVTCEYVETTGDESLWQETVRYLTAAEVPPGEPEIFLVPQDTGESGSVYDHCCRALDRGLTKGRYGLPLIGCGDWNDGMNRVGQEGQGESVWMGFFIDFILQKFIPICERFGEAQRAARYRTYQQQLRVALEDAGWDGKWYRRAYFDDGTPLGTADADECRIDALVQAWSVLSGVAPPERAASAMAAAEEHLVDRRRGLIRLLTPPCDQMAHDPGYIKGYLPGVRENGGQYTHGILWFIRALAELGSGTQAVELLEMITPVMHGNSREAVEIYQAEPYVVAADVYGAAPHEGRGGWSWYTGSAGWMFRVAFESVLGIHLEEGRKLRINPQISADWPAYRVKYRLPETNTQLHITVENPNRRERGVTHAELNGQPVEVSPNGALFTVPNESGEHRILVRL